MQSARPMLNRLFAVRKDMLRGDSLFALIIFAVVALFLFNLVASIWHNMVFQKDIEQKASVRHAESVGRVLARAAESLMATNELSALRRTIAETALEHHLRSCRILLPDGGILADADPASITLVTLPASWEGAVAPYSQEFSRRTARFTYPLMIPGRGNATLKVTAGVDDRLDAALAPQTAQMAIACLALASMLLVHRHSRFRLKAIGAIQEVLLAVREDGADLSTLELDPRLGTEAVAWNKLLGDRQDTQIRTAIQQVRDTAHERSETAEALEAAVDAISAGLVLVNCRLEIEHVNGAGAVLLQGARSQLLHEPIERAVKDEHVLAAVRQAAANPTARRVVLEVEQGGTITTGVLRFAVMPLRRGRSDSVLITIDDVTQQRVAQAAMNSFLAKAAHELRTPLTNIRLFVEEALDYCEKNPAAVSPCLNVINDESQRLDRSVAEILSVSQIEAGSFEIRRDDVHLGEMLQKLQLDHEAQAREKRIAYEFELPPKLPTFQGDRDKIALALHNLVGNALKYTLAGGRVVVSAQVERSRVSVAVTDTGLGIGPDETEKVFEKFYRSKNPLAAGVKGSGLGLPIAREIARLHGGDIILESQLGQGSTFTLILPLMEEKA
ncbi:MAG: ATP-binding protein [Planctomycetes bacterium]|nr:ATP-binding protein [Planctomycetota bacterium]